MVIIAELVDRFIGLNAAEWATAISLVVALVSLLIARSANQHAREANRLADKSNDIASKALEVTKRANAPSLGITASRAPESTKSNRMAAVIRVVNAGKPVLLDHALYCPPDGSETRMEFENIRVILAEHAEARCRTPAFEPGTPQHAMLMGTFRVRVVTKDGDVVEETLPAHVG